MSRTMPVASEVVALNCRAQVESSSANSGTRVLTHLPNQASRPLQPSTIAWVTAGGREAEA